MALRLVPLLILIAAVPGAARTAETLPPGTQWAQLSIRERIVIRIPRVRPPPPDLPPDAPPPVPGAPAPGWIEKRGDRCVPAGDIAGAMIVGSGRLDFVMGDGRRTRAVLEQDCPALDYYLGFYIRPTRDGLVCAGRDAVRSRSGAACPIRAFRRLEPRR